MEHSAHSDTRARKEGISLDEEDLNCNIKDYNEVDSYSTN
jgi:hypothetical protein